MKCPNCNGEVPDNKSFCGHCGHKLETVDSFDDSAATRLSDIPISLLEKLNDDTPIKAKPQLEDSPKKATPKLPREKEALTCPACGAPNRTGARYCDNCATKLVEDEVEQPLPEMDRQEKKEPAEPGMADDVSPRPSTRPLWQLVLFIAAGWAISSIIGENIRKVIFFALYNQGMNFDTIVYVVALINGAIFGTLGGLTTGIVLRYNLQQFNKKQMAIVTIGWMIAWTIISPALYLSQFIFWAFTGLVGGLFTGWTLKMNELNLHGKRFFFVVLGWMFGWLVSSAIYEILRDGSSSYWLLLWVSTGAIGGAIGGGVTLWQLRKAQNK